jgi:hypothetical protein
MPTALLLAAILAASSLDTPPHSAPRVRLALDIEFPPGAPERMASAVIAEATSIWSRYGVEIVARTPAPCQWLPDNVTALDVRLAAHVSSRGRTPLASIVFSPEGDPGHVISVFYDDIVRASTRSALASAEPEWPLALRQQVIARVLGRVIAHEIGHFLLRSPAHAQKGLMRPVQSTMELALGATSLFLLTTMEVERLDRTLGADKEKGPADSRPLK